MANITREKFKTYASVFDNFTMANLVELAKKRLFVEGTLSPVKMGKEAVVFYAEDEKRKKICIKIYRLETANFNKMYEYIRSDPRFIGLIHKQRKIIFAWVQREFRNLLMAERLKIPAPRPLQFQMNALIMDFIGDETPAPMLKDAKPRQPDRFYSQVVKGMKTLYEAGFAHGDLSKFNILNHNEKAVLIDFSHATPNVNPIFRTLLDRDAKNVADYFVQQGVKTSKEQLLKEITSARPL